MNRRDFLHRTPLSLSLVGAPRPIRPPPASAEDQTTSQITDFDAEAIAALPIEERYHFVRVLTEGRDEPGRDPNARPASQELALPSTGWTLIIPSDAGDVLRVAAEYFKSYLAQSMQTSVTLEARPSLANWQSISKAIIAAPKDKLPGCGTELQRNKDYRIHLSEQRAVVCGFDERGAMYGLYNLAARMTLREAPFLPADLSVVRHSLYSTRMTLSGIGYMEWPDQYLALLARYGF